MSVKKLWSYNTPIRFYGRKSKKSSDFEKSKLKMRLRHAGRDLSFGIKLFLREPLKNFLCAIRPYLMYLSGLLRLALCVSKKIMTLRHVNHILYQGKQKIQKLFWKNSKILDFKKKGNFLMINYYVPNFAVLCRRNRKEYAPHFHRIQSPYIGDYSQKIWRS